MPYIEDGLGYRFLLGIHRGIVVDRNDTSEISDTPHRGRIKVEIPYLQDEENDGLPYHWWCDYCGPSHQFFSVPAIGTIVYVAFNGGTPEQPVWLGAANTTALSKDPPTRFRRDEPDVSGYESLGGHFLEFNDITGERRIRIEDLNGNFREWNTELNDLNVLYKNNENREIQNDRFTIIGHDDQLNIGNDNRITIVNDQTRDIGNNQTLTVGLNQTETIGNDRTQTVTNNDSLTVILNKTQAITGTWDDTITGAYSKTGQSTGTWDFQSNISVTTATSMIYDVGTDWTATVGANWSNTVTGDWINDVTGNWTNTVTGDWDNTITGDYKATVTKAIDFKATTDIALDATQIAKMKNILFEFELGLATSTWKLITGTSSIVMTAASISITVGGTTQVWSSGGSTFIGSAYILGGIDHINHQHTVTTEFTPTGVEF